ASGRARVRYGRSSCGVLYGGCRRRRRRRRADDRGAGRRTVTIQSNPAPGNGSPPKREAPQRPLVRGANEAPVLVKVPPPFSIRLSQFFWIMSFAVGGFTVVYFFIIRQGLLPLIADVAKGVTEGRDEATYKSAAD